MTLSPTVIASLQAASRSAVEGELSRIIENWSHTRWLSVRNRYRIDTVEKLKTELGAGGLRSPAQLAQYIAASAVLHAMDGWTFLGKAISSHIRGDCDTARHLAYYAELRAAMSLLASEGVGAFDKQHFVIKQPRSASFVGGAPATHVFVWEALDLWAGSNAASSTVISLIRPDGKPLLEWLNAFSATPGATGLLAHSWIAAWGVDLKRLTDDRQGRNLSSYRPTEFHFRGVDAVDESVRAVAELWRLAQPIGAGGFSMLDAYLLRQGLERKFKALQPYGRSSRQSKRQFRAQIRSMIHTVGPSAAGGFDWEAFLTREVLGEDPKLLQHAAGVLKPGQKGHDLQVICRAALLLRIASGSNSELLRSAGHENLETLDFWLLPLAERLGLCRASGLPVDRADFWADIEPSLIALEEWAEDATNEKSVFKLNEAKGADVQLLSSAEIAGIWALRI